MAPPPILLLTHSRDVFVPDAVVAALEGRGARALRVDTDLFPSRMALTVRLARGQREVWLDTGAEALRLDTVPAVWSRRLWPGAPPPGLPPKYAQQCAAESRRAFLAALRLLERPRWVNPLDAAVAAENKLLQLVLAQEEGLVVPSTLLTNAPAQVPPFFRACEGRMVTKLMGALSQTVDASGDFLYTSRVREEDLEALEGLSLAPMLFQPLVPKVRELRVVAVGESLFCGALDARGVPRAEVDWRRATVADGLSWTHAALPEDCATAVRQMMRRLGLVFGAFDFLVDEEGTHTFLEVNPAGEWGWLQKDLGLPVADALAAALLGERPGQGRMP